MPSISSYTRLLHKGYPLDKSIYNRLDSLETNSDIEDLANVCSQHRGIDGNCAHFTLNYLAANPDFDQIQKEDYSSYHYQDIQDTLNAYENSDKVVEIVKEGIKENIFSTEFHGREHINVNRWMALLNQELNKFHDAFKERTFTINNRPNSSGHEDCLDAFDNSINMIYEPISSILETGVDLHTKIWGKKPKSFIAPCYIWDKSIEKCLVSLGLQYIQGTNTQRYYDTSNHLKKKYHYLGQENRFRQIYLIRNCFFEPAAEGVDKALDRAKSEIVKNLNMGIPAIVCSHRVNYMSRLNETNKTKNLEALNQLLGFIKNRYSDVEFYSSSDLGNLIKEN